MALSDEVSSRYSTSRLTALTRQDDQTTGSVDTTVLGLACDDVAAEIEVRCGVAYDNADARHVAYGVRGVIALLGYRAGTQGSQAAWDSWVESLRSLGRVTGQDRLTPETGSPLEPTPDDEGRTAPVRPYFDRRRTQGYTLDPPHSGEAGEDTEE